MAIWASSAVGLRAPERADGTEMHIRDSTFIAILENGTSGDSWLAHTAGGWHSRDFRLALSLPAPVNREGVRMHGGTWILVGREAL